jgi:hypothetical protein
MKVEEGYEFPPISKAINFTMHYGRRNLNLNNDRKLIQFIEMIYSSYSNLAMAHTAVEKKEII